jgi:hypothetical protein
MSKMAAEMITNAIQIEISAMVRQPDLNRSRPSPTKIPITPKLMLMRPRNGETITSRAHKTPPSRNTAATTVSESGRSRFIFG